MDNELKRSIEALESQRKLLGDAVVDAGIAALQKEIRNLQPPHNEERKLVTVLFCDIVGSSSMAADKDPEEVLGIINGALQEMSSAIEAFGGTVTRYMGDGILAIFGAPLAIERHAEQAIHAGLSIQSRILSYEQMLLAQGDVDKFQVRVGINSGRAVAGRVGGSKGEYTVIGDVINMASRIESAAPAGGVLVGKNSFLLAGGYQKFEADSWEPILVKGRPTPLSVYQVFGTVVSQQVHTENYPPIYGRKEELRHLKSLYFQVAESGKLKIVRITGPAGIGKTRLMQEMLVWFSGLVPKPSISLGTAFIHTTQTPYALVTEILSSTLGLKGNTGQDNARTKLTQALGNNGPEENDIYLHALGTILAVPFENSALEYLEPSYRREVIFEAFLNFWQQTHGRPAAVLIIEDSHWADSLSLELLNRLAREHTDLPLLILYFSRPDEESIYLDPIKSGIPSESYLEIRLHSLGLAATHDMAQQLLKNSNLPISLIEALTDHSNGNPFFIKELLKNYRETNLLVQQESGWEFILPEGGTEVPNTLEGILAARIDRLHPQEKQALQHAAIIGRHFGENLLSKILGGEVGEMLNNLQDKEYLTKTGDRYLGDDKEWTFNHALLQQVAYENVLLESRQKIHARLAVMMEEAASDRLDEYAPILGWHFEKGDKWEKAINYLKLAAERSANVFALTEAINFYNQCIDLAQIHKTVFQRDLLMELFLGRGDVRALEYKFEGAKNDFVTVLNEAKSINDEEKELALLVRLGFLFRNADRLDEANEILNAALVLARKGEDLRSVADILYHLGTVAWTLGQNNLALSHQKEAVQICKDLEYEDIVAVQALHGLGEALHFGGNAKKAIKAYERSIKLAKKIGDKNFECENLYMLGFSHNGRDGSGKVLAGQKKSNKAVEMSQAYRLDGHAPPALLVSGLLNGMLGDYKTGLAQLEQSKQWSEKLGVLRFLTAVQLRFGQLYESLNLHHHALASDQAGLNIAEEHNIRVQFAGLQARVALDKLHLGDLDVEDSLKEILQSTQKYGNHIHGIPAIIGLIELAYLTQSFSSGFEFQNRLITYAKSGGMKETLARAYYYEGLLLSAQEDYLEAEASYKSAAAIMKNLNGFRTKWDVQVGLVDVYRSLEYREKANQHAGRANAMLIKVQENLKGSEFTPQLPILEIIE